MSMLRLQQKNSFKAVFAFGLFFAAVFAISASSQAAFNPTINYQGKLTAPSGIAVVDGSYDMEFNLYTAPTGGTPIWTETRTTDTVSGLFSVMLGSVTPLTSVDFNQTLYLGVSIEADAEMTPRKILGAVPAAFEAQNAQTVGDVASTSFLRSDQADTATGLLTFSNGFISQASSSIALLTTLTATTTNLVINGERFTDLTGTGLSNTAGILTVNTSYLNTLYASTTAFDTSAELRAILTDETGTGSLVFSSSPTFTGTSVFANVSMDDLFVADGFDLGGTLREVSDDVEVYGGDLIVSGGSLEVSGGSLEISGGGLIMSSGNIALGSNFLSGDGTNEGISISSNGDVTFSASSTFAGRVGIGTTAPIADLNVAGNVIIGRGNGDEGGSGSLSVGQSAWAYGAYSLAVGNGAIANTDASIALGQTAGAYGESSLAMGYQPQANGDFSIALGSAMTGSGYGGNGEGLHAMAIGLGNMSGARPMVTGTSSLGIFLGDQSGLEVSTEQVMAIMGGNVGIGTASPDELLVASSSGYSKMKVVGQSSSSLVVDTSATGSKAFVLGAGPYGTALNFDNSGYFTLQSKPKNDLESLNGVVSLLVDGVTGNVGIGSTAALSLSRPPRADLEVIVQSGEAQRITGTTGTYLTFYKDLTPETYFGFGGSGEIFTNGLTDSTALRAQNALQFGTNGDNIRLTIDTSGNVGIGTSTPSQMLTVAGNARITGALYDSNNSAGTSGYVLQSTGTGQQWVATSSLGFGTSNFSTAQIDTSSEIAGIVGDETGTGNLVFSNAPAFSGTVTFSALTATSTLTMSGTAANIALGSNWLSGDGQDEGVFVSSTGNVGIGTASATSLLTVAGPSSFNGVINVTGGVNVLSGTSYLLDTSVTGTLGVTGKTTLTNASTTNLTITGALYDSNNSAGTSGYVLQSTGTGQQWVATSTLGFGTGSVDGAGSANRLAFWSDADTISYDGSLRFTPDFSNPMLELTGDSAEFVISGTSGGASVLTVSPASISYGDGGGSSVLHFVSNNIGINDSTPAALFTVGNGDLFQINSSGAIAASTGITTTGQVTLSGTAANIALGSNFLSGDGGDEGVSIVSNGDLTFTGASGDTLLVALNEGSGYPTFYSSGDVVSFASNVEVLDGLEFSISDTGNDRFAYLVVENNGATVFGNTAGDLALLSTGNVGIGTSTPSHTLTVAGNSLIAGALSFAKNDPSSGIYFPADNYFARESWNDTADQTGILMPMYIYPGSIFTNTDFNEVIELKNRYKNVPLYVILNPGNGPGNVTDGNYSAAIERLHGAGAVVLGYIATQYMASSTGEMASEIDDWLTYYPQIDGIFMDEMTNTTVSNELEHYETITRYAHGKGLYPVIGNPGSGVGGAYFSSPTADIIVTVESGTFPNEAALKQDFDNGYADYTYKKRASLVYGQSDFNTANISLLKKYTGLIYVTDDALSPNPWDSVSSHLETLFEFLSSEHRRVFTDMYVDGKLGIGTTTPSHVLSVVGNALITGTTTFAGNISISGSIIPTADITYDLGSPTHQWKDVYIGPGSLYINGKKVIEDVSDTITISTDDDQNLMTETTGIGNVTMRAVGSGNVALLSGSGNININSTSGNINLGTTGSGQLNLGTVTSGVWHGSAIGALYGGTGLSSYATGDMIYASGSNTLAKRSIGSAGSVLSVVGGVPTWVATSTLGISSGASVAGSLGQIQFNNGGTLGATSSLGYATSTRQLRLSDPWSGSVLGSSLYFGGISQIGLDTDEIMSISAAGGIVIEGGNNEGITFITQAVSDEGFNFEGSSDTPFNFTGNSLNVSTVFGDLVFDYQGRLGIGTTTPSQALTVVGNARITGALFDSNNSAGTSGYVLQSTGTGQRWVATSTLGFGTSGLTAADIDTSAELAAILTDAVGSSGGFVRATSPTFVTSVLSPAFISTAADPADAGAIRLGNAEVIGWEASPTGTDVSLSVNASEQFIFSGAGALTPSGNDGASLGVSGTAFADLFLAAGGVVNIGAGDTTITGGTNVLTFAGATTNGYQFQDGPIRPVANDGIALGTATVSFSDLFLASGAVVNFANGNSALTHSSGVLTVSTGDLRVTTAGTNSASVVTVGGAQTLANKTLAATNLSGNFTLTGTTANIALGSNFLSGDGSDEGVSIDANGNATVSGSLFTTNYIAYNSSVAGGLYLTPTGQAAIGSPAAEFFVYNTNSDAVIGIAAPDGAVTGGIGTFSNHDLYFFTNYDTDHMVITTAGLVGIGTSTPTSKLTVAGTSNFTGNLTLSGTAANIALGSNFLSGDGGDEGVSIASNGNLTFTGASGDTLLLSLNEGSGYPTLYSSGDVLSFGSNAEILDGYALTIYDSGNDRSAYLTVENNGTTILGNSAGNLALLPAGNVGIGTSTPVSPLTVVGTTTHFGNIQFGSISGAAQNYSIAPNGLYSSGGHTLSVSGGYGEYDNGGSLTLSGGGCSSSCDGGPVFIVGGGMGGVGNAGGVYINGGNSMIGYANVHLAHLGGSVNIGAGFPSQKLDINGTNAQTLIEESTTEFLRMGVGETSNTAVIGWDDADALHLGVYSSPTDTTIDSKMTILSNGNVGIGTSTPNSRLHVYGNAGFAYGLNVTNVHADAYGAYIYVGNNKAARQALQIDNSTGSIFAVHNNGNVAIGTTTPNSLLAMEKKTGLTGPVTAGIDQYFNFTNSSAGAVYYGDKSYIVNAPTSASTLVGKMLRIEDSTALANTVRGLEVQAHRGTNTQGENTAISGFARTFGVRGTTEGDAGGVFEPAGVFAETKGTTQGNALRGYSGSITTSDLLSLFQDTSAFAGTGLLMNFGNSGGSFSSTTSKFVDFQTAGTSKFTIRAHGMTTIGDGTTSNNAGLQIGYGGLCVDNDGSCTASTTGRITSVSSAVGNSDLAEMYFGDADLQPGDIIATAGILSIEKADAENSQNIIGVISTKPGLTLGFDDTSLTSGQTGHPVALSGRVPIKLSTENGPIKTGDKIVLSSIAGVGMKAIAGGVVVGTALEDFDGEYAYSEGFIDQFGDDIAESNTTPFNVETDTRIHDGCSFGGGGALGEDDAECDPRDTDRFIAIETTVADRNEEMREALMELAQQHAEEMETPDGKEVSVGQALMFVNLGWHQTVQEQTILAELTSTSTDLVLGSEDGEETLWSRLKTLAQGFVDGILSVTGLRAQNVYVENELCVDGVCLNSADLRALLQEANRPQSGSGTGAPPPPPAVEPPADEPVEEVPEEGSTVDEGPQEPVTEGSTETPPVEEEIIEEPQEEAPEVQPEEEDTPEELPASEPPTN